MIGPKKLRTIRAELRRKLAAGGEDPILWLEERMTASERTDSTAPGGSEVLHSLRRFLEGSGKEKRRTQGSGSKK
jgi:hypothetical protein